MKRSPLKSKSVLKAKQPLKAKNSGLTRRSSSMKSSKPRKGSVAQLKKKADVVWSRATRLRHAENRDGEWWAQCVTCGDWKPISKLQCGHFMSRQHNSTRYHELNTAPQCYGCNVMQQGKQYEFGIWLDDMYGTGTAKEMYDLSKVPHQFKPEELEQIIAEANEEIKWYAQEEKG